MPAVGRWRSADARAWYVAAYRAVLSDLRRPPDDIDVDVPHGTVHVLHWPGPSAMTPVLLMPGRSSGAPMWAENLPDWIGKRPIYALDPLGDAGLSTQRAPLASPTDQATWIAALMTALGIAKAHVVGHSFGGATATVLAVEKPTLVASLALIEPVAVIERIPLSGMFWATLTLLPLPQSIKDRALAKIGGAGIDEVLSRSPISEMIDAASAGYRAALPNPRRLTDDQWRRLSMPLRVDLAGGSPLAGGRTAADRLRTLVPTATVTLWPDATHSLPMQEKETLGHALLEFWSGADRAATESPG